MSMTLKTTIKELEKQEEQSKKKHYMGDAAEYAFRRWVLILLSGKKNKLTKRKQSAYHQLVGDFMRKGNTVKESHRLAKEQIKK